MEPRRPPEAAGPPGLPSRDIAAGFDLGRSDGMVAASRRWRPGSVRPALCQNEAAPPSAPLGAGSATESYAGPTTLFVSSVVDIVRTAEI